MGFEIHTAAPLRARRFYWEIFGADVVRSGRRWVVISPSAPACSSRVRRIAVDDLDRCVAAVIAAGGREVIAKIAVTGGFVAYCQDPDGNVLWIETRCAPAARRPRLWSGSRGGRARDT